MDNAQPIIEVWQTEVRNIIFTLKINIENLRIISKAYIDQDKRNKIQRINFFDFLGRMILREINLDLCKIFSESKNQKLNINLLKSKLIDLKVDTSCLDYAFAFLREAENIEIFKKIETLRNKTIAHCDVGSYKTAQANSLWPKSLEAFIEIAKVFYIEVDKIKKSLPGYQAPDVSVVDNLSDIDSTVFELRDSIKPIFDML